MYSNILKIFKSLSEIWPNSVHDLGLGDGPQPPGREQVLGHGQFGTGPQRENKTV